MKLELLETTIEQEPPFAGEPVYVDLLYPDCYQPDGSCYVWFQFEPDETWDPVTDVCPVNLSSLRPGHWLDTEASNWGFDHIFLETVSFGSGWYLDLMLKEGLYLSQPFLVAFDAPEEPDVFSWEIIHRAEVTPEMVSDTVRFLEGVVEG